MTASPVAPYYKAAATAAFKRQFDCDLVITDLEGGDYHMAKRKDGVDLTAEEKRFIAGFHEGWTAAGEILDPKMAGMEEALRMIGTVEFSREMMAELARRALTAPKRKESA